MEELENGHFPKCWSEGFIIPIPFLKNGDPNPPENYRGIIFLSTFGKIFTRKLINHNDDHVCIEAQLGFRTNMGTADNIFVLNGLICHMLNENKHVFVCYIDFAKAFDFVVTENLLLKLNSRLGGKYLKVLKSMYPSIK